jgi:hypothetical protein
MQIDWLYRHGERSAFIAHILGRRGTSASCPYASEEAKREALAHRDESDTTKMAKWPPSDESKTGNAHKKSKTTNVGSMTVLLR